MTGATFTYEVSRTGGRVALVIMNGCDRFSDTANPRHQDEIEELLDRARGQFPGLADDIDGRLRTELLLKAASDTDDVEPIEFPQNGPHGFVVTGLAGHCVNIEVCDSNEETVLADSFDPSKGPSLSSLFTRVRRNGGVKLSDEQRVEVSRWLTGLDLCGRVAEQQVAGNPSWSPGTMAADLALTEALELFHDDADDKRGYVDIRAGQGIRTLRVSSRDLKRWVDHLYYRVYRAALSSEARNQAIAQLEAVAEFDGRHREVSQRVAQVGDRIWIDLGDDSYRVVEVSPGGWEIVSEPPIRFWRSSSMRPLPMPVRGGDVNLLREAINVGLDDEGGRRFRLIVAYLLGSLSGHKPFPILILNGEQGSGKSTLSRVIRSLIDPRKAGLRQTPKSLRDLAVAGENSWLISYDNLSELRNWLSDGLCSLATGSGFGTRQLFTNDEERAFEQARPIPASAIAPLFDPERSC